MPGQHDDESRSRAARLREQIDKLKRSGDKNPSEKDVPKPDDRPRTPRDFIHDRMRELDKNKDD